jgi:hypothetical protein
VDFNHEKLANVELLLWICFEQPQQALNQLRDDFRMIVQLNRDDSGMPAGRICNDIGEIAVERKERSAHIAGLPNYRYIRRADRHHLAKRHNIVSLLTNALNDLSRHTVVGEKTQAPAGTASNSASSRA